MRGATEWQSREPEAWQCGTLLKNLNSNAKVTKPRNVTKSRAQAETVPGSVIGIYQKASLTVTVIEGILYYTRRPYAVSVECIHQRG